MAGCSGLLLGLASDRREIEAFQARQLRALVRHAYDRVPYYRGLFDKAGLNPNQIRTLEDLAKIPATSRADLQSLPAQDIVARGFNPERLVIHRTSGSSGEPLSIRRTRSEHRLLRAYRLRVLFHLGLRITDRRVAVVTPRLTRTPLYMKAGLLPYEEIHCLWDTDRILSKLRERPPDVLTGYPGTLSWLAGHLTNSDRDRIRPRFITTDSETLTSDMRARISEGFRAPIVDFYDSHEFNMIAWECPSSALYHVSDASVIAEIIRNGHPAGPDEDGELVGTALHSWAMPFIRFRLGDLVTRGAARCPCGAPNSTIARVQGRIADRFHLPEGRTIHPYVLVNPLLNHAPWLRQYEIVQEQTAYIRLRLVPMRDSTPPLGSVAEVGRMLSRVLGGSVRVDVELVNKIPARPNGKFRPYYSLVSSQVVRQTE